MLFPFMGIAVKLPVKHICMTESPRFPRQPNPRVIRSLSEYLKKYCDGFVERASPLGLLFLTGNLKEE